MSIAKITDNPTLALASLIRPHEDRLPVMRAKPHSSFAMVDGEGIGVHFEKTLQDEEDLVSAYGEYITSIDRPSRFARAWNDFASLLLRTAATIAVGLETIAAARGNQGIDARIERTTDLAILGMLSPYIKSLGSLFNVSNSFGRNRIVVERWEEAFSRGQRHQLGNALFFMTRINKHLDSGMLSYEDLIDTLEETHMLFDPITYMRESYAEDIAGRWLRIRMSDESHKPIMPRNKVALRRVLGELLYRAGTSANGSPEELEVEWMGEASALVFRSANGAFSPFDVDAPARNFVTNLYGKENIQFLGNGASHSPISEIRIAVYTTPMMAAGGAIAPI